MHFVIEAFPDLWDLIQDWVHTTDEAQFDAWWEQMRTSTKYPDTVIKYLARDWVPCRDMWSAIFRKNRTIFEEGDTNMLLES
jgi:hypothetical protein